MQLSTLLTLHYRSPLFACSNTQAEQVKASVIFLFKSKFDCFLYCLTFHSIFHSAFHSIPRFIPTHPIAPEKWGKWSMRRQSVPGSFLKKSLGTRLVPSLLQASSHLVPLLLQASSHLVPLLLQASCIPTLLSFFIKTFLLYFNRRFQHYILTLSWFGFVSWLSCVEFYYTQNKHKFKSADNTHFRIVFRWFWFEDND